MSTIISFIQRIPVIKAFHDLRKGKHDLIGILILVTGLSAVSSILVFISTIFSPLGAAKIFVFFVASLFTIPLFFNQKTLKRYLVLYLAIVIPIWYPVAIVLWSDDYGQALASATTIFITVLLIRKNVKLRNGIVIYNLILFLVPKVYVILYGTVFSEIHLLYDEILVYVSCLGWLSVTFYIYDDTKTKEFTQRLKAKNRELIVSNKKLNEKSKQIEEFAFIITHDLQEPLRNIGSISAMLKQSIKEDEEASSETELMYDFLESSSSRLIKQVRGLLDFASVGKVKKKQLVKANEVLSTVIKDLQLLIKETNTKIHFGELPTFSAYEIEFRLLFQNLISNAIKYRDDNRTPEIYINAEEIENGYLFSIQDNGIGIDAVQKDQIFKVFNRLHQTEKYEGLGLGLANCKRIVELHNGEIWVESEPSKGSTFMFTVKTNQVLVR